MSNDQIKKQVFLKSTRSRVWRALTDSREFGHWFGMSLEGPFKAGSKMQGKIKPTKADPEVAKMQKPYEDMPVELWVNRIEPETLFSFEWHPYAVDKSIDYSNEPKTMVTFTLEEKDGGVLLTVTESGYDKVPADRKEEAIKANDGGWAMQMQLIEKYLKNEK